jgi:CBS domain-containing protein
LSQGDKPGEKTMPSNGPAMRLRDRPEFASKPKPLALAGSASVAEGVARMCELDFGSVIVVDGEGRVEGVVTERDIMKRLVNQGRDPSATQLKEIMTSNPRVAKADDDLLDWLRIMSNERFRRLPVVDDQNRIVAVMTQGDFVSYTWPDLVYQGRQMMKATVFKNYHLFLIGGGVMAYSLIMILLLRTI